jgi:hypothetical protein
MAGTATGGGVFGSTVLGVLVESEAAEAARLAGEHVPLDLRAEFRGGKL